MAETKLKKYFPMIRTRAEILSDIEENTVLSEMYGTWNEKHQKEFLDICTGVKGVKLLYDSFSKEILNPETAPERLEELLSLLLEKQVQILTVLPNDNTRIADESSLLIMDIVVELEDGSLANVEIQKLGYLFPGQRCACYSADLLLRHYKRVKSEQEYIFVPLDIFQENLHNKSIKNKLDAWLTFLSTDAPEDIINLIEIYPEFRKMYEEVYLLCRNMEKVMGMFSKELLELDRNTVQYMIDEMQDTIDEQKQALNEKDNVIDEQKESLRKKDSLLAQQRLEMEALRKELERLTK